MPPKLEENKSDIVSFVHCRRCLEETGHAGVYESGFTHSGFQVNCPIHGNIVDLDFCGQTVGMNGLELESDNPLFKGVCDCCDAEREHGIN